MRILPVLYLAATALAISTLHATEHRGVWFWNNTKVDGVDSPHGSKFVVGDNAKENSAITFLKCMNIKEVYGSYRDRPRDEPATIRAWNAKLEAAGIESQLLISGFEPDGDSTLTDPDHTSLIVKVTERLIDFNNTASPAESFDALHLDLEPQSLDTWKDSATSVAVRRAFLDDLLDAYNDIRAALDAAGYSTIPIYADIPWNWDKMPLPDPADGKVGWASTADRDAWYAAIDGPLDGVSLMTFTPSKDTIPELADATLYERTGPYAAAGGDPTRIAIQPKVGPGEIWPTYSAFTSILSGLETGYGGAADVENYAFWRHAFADFGPSWFKTCLPSIHAEPELINDGSGGGVIIFTGTPGYLYQIKSSGHPGGGWQPVGQPMRTRTLAAREQFRIPVELPPGRGFFTVTEAEDNISMPVE